MRPDPNEYVGASCGNQSTACDAPKTTRSYTNPRLLIEDTIHFHNTRANGLCALLRALPGEMSREAEHALATLILEARFPPR